MLVAGRISANTSACARPASSQREMSVTYIRVRITCSNPAPASARAPPITSSVARAWPCMSPTCATEPSGWAAVLPEIARKLPERIARE